jgi:hypothetical protein
MNQTASTARAIAPPTKPPPCSSPLGRERRALSRIIDPHLRTKTPRSSLDVRLTCLLQDRDRAPQSRVCQTILEEEKMVLKAIKEWRQKRKLRNMLTDQRSARGFRSTGQLEKGISADRATTEQLLRSMGARKSDGVDEWTLNSSK